MRIWMMAGLAATAASAASAGVVPGTVVITVPDAQAADKPFADAIEQALFRSHFTILPGTGHSRYIAEVHVVRDDRGAVRTRASAGGATPSFGAGGSGVAVSLGSNWSEHDLVATRLTITLVERQSRAVVWSGSALTVQADGTGAGSPAALANKLVGAAMASYPTTVAGTISVP